jgi:hypothetical protein
MTRSPSGMPVSIRTFALFAALVAIVSGCRSRTTLKPPEPAKVKVEHTPAQVVQSASLELTTAGFQVMSSDRNRGVLTAQASGRTNDLRPFIKCAPADEAAVMQLGTSVITVNVSAEADGSASEVTVLVRTITKAFQGGRNAINDDITCVSNGSLEARLGRAIRL